MGALGMRPLTMGTLTMRALMWKYLICTLLIPASAVANYYDRKAEGWHWYELRPVISNQSSEKKSPIQALQAFKGQIAKLKATAVMNPTFENVRAYMQIQKALMDRSGQFARKWLEVVYTTPSLDYSIKHPTSQVGRHVYLDQQQHQMDTQIRKLAKTHGLFFFYSDCPYCKKFAPIVKAFSQKYGWQVLAISTDGTMLPEFPDARINNGSAQVLGVRHLPTLLAVEPKTGEVIPLSYGLSTHDQIEDRIRVLLRRKP